jgi:hypothetical protein
LGTRVDNAPWRIHHLIHLLPFPCFLRRAIGSDHPQVLTIHLIGPWS